MDKKEILKQYFGYDEFKYPQDIIIDNVLSGKDVIGILPTGFGKSLIFQVLALLQDGLCIIISPLIALMEDQYNNLLKNDIKVAVLNSSLDIYEQDIIFNKIKKGKYKMLYLSPERLENKRFKDFINDIDIKMIVIDEAHTLLWGESFRESFNNIGLFIESLKNRPKLLALTATATPKTVEKIKNKLNMTNPLIIQMPMDRPNIFYKVYHTNKKEDFLYKYLDSKKEDKGIIYCLTIKKTIELYNKLKNKYKVCYYHAKLDNKTKQEQQMLYSSNKCNIIIATNAYGMGINIKNIRYIIEYELPTTIEDLTQQLGRAGRDNEKSEGIVLFSFNDVYKVRYFINKIDDDNIRKEYIKKLDSLVDYCLSKKCRHQYLSNYFEQKLNKCNNMCDNCKKNNALSIIF